jgi:2-oxoglutarate ferredoxin oxidoreductase subunit beta
MHDGSVIALRKIANDYDPTDKQQAFAHLRERQIRGEMATGLLYIDQKSGDMHDMNATPDVPLTRVPFEKLCPGSAALDKLQEAFR